MTSVISSRDENIIFFLTFIRLLFYGRINFILVFQNIYRNNLTIHVFSCCNFVKLFFYKLSSRLHQSYSHSPVIFTSYWRLLLKLSLMYRNIYSRANSWEVSEHVRVSATIVVTNNSLKTVPIFYAKFLALIT